MKEILVIGGSSGIGEAITKKVATNNNVIATYRNNFKENTKILSIEFDVTKNIQKNWKLSPLDSIIYCPGTINLKPFHRFSEQELIDIFKCYWLFEDIIFLQKKLATARKCFGDSFFIRNHFTQVACSKGAIEALTRTLAAELAPKIRVNAIAPSLLNTPLSTKFIILKKK